MFWKSTILFQVITFPALNIKQGWCKGCSELLQSCLASHHFIFSITVSVDQTSSSKHHLCCVASPAWNAFPLRSNWAAFFVCQSRKWHLSTVYMYFCHFHLIAVVFSTLLQAMWEPANHCLRPWAGSWSCHSILTVAWNPPEKPGWPQELECRSRNICYLEVQPFLPRASIDSKHPCTVRSWER